VEKMKQGGGTRKSKGEEQSGEGNKIVFSAGPGGQEIREKA